GWSRRERDGVVRAGRRPVPRRYTRLLDTAPLRELLGREIRFDRIRENIDQGLLRGMAISATNYETGTSVTFFDGVPELQPWARSRRMGVGSGSWLAQVMVEVTIPLVLHAAER